VPGLRVSVFHDGDFHGGLGTAPTGKRGDCAIEGGFGMFLMQIPIVRDFVALFPETLEFR